jgi:hypothetical protein
MAYPYSHGARCSAAKYSRRFVCGGRFSLHYVLFRAPTFHAFPSIRCGGLAPPIRRNAHR